MDRHFSTYMNFLRVVAAFLVLLSHLDDERFTGGTLALMRDGIGYGHHAVIIFFVLSGLVIAYTADRTPTLTEFVTARLARMYSVVVPMVLIIPLLDLLGSRFDPQLYSGSTEPVGVMIAAALTFSHRFWFSQIDYFSNEPYWSISYEVAYYLLFALWFYLRGTARWLLLTLAILTIGPVILLLMPPWIAGVLLWRWRDRLIVGKRLALLLMLGAPMVYAVAGALGVFTMLNWFCTLAWRALGTGEALWSLSANWATDYLITILLCAHLIGVWTLCRTGSLQLERLRKGATWLADGSFALYLFHQPLIALAAAMLGPFRNTPYGMLALLLAATLGSYLLAEISDRRRRIWISAFQSMVAGVRAKRV